MLETHPKVTQPPCYVYHFRYLCDERGGSTAATLTAELRSQGVPAVFGGCRPVYRSPEFGWNDPRVERADDYSRISCPIAEAAADELIAIPHPFFMARRSVIVKAAGAVVAATRRLRGERDDRI